METEEIRQHMKEVNESLPNNWVSGIGERIGEECYTHWYYHQGNEWEITVYSDPGQPHTVNLFEVRGQREDGDWDVSEYPERSKQFETAEEAEEFAVELMQEHQ